jgi:hypothetical protein
MRGIGWCSCSWKEEESRSLILEKTVSFAWKPSMASLRDATDREVENAIGWQTSNYRLEFIGP